MRHWIGFLFPLVAAAQALTPQAAIEIRDLSELQFSPDGQRLALSVRAPSGRSSQRHIWVCNTSTGDLRQWTDSAKSEHEPRWSPDGKVLAFLSDREDDSQIWLMPVDGGEAVKLTSAKNSISTFRWSRDGRRIAYLANDPKTEAEEKKTKDFDDAQVIENDDKPTRLWTVDVGSRQVHAQTKGPWTVHELEWMPDGRSLLVVATDRPHEVHNTNRILRLQLEDGRLDEVLAPRGPFSTIRVSPRGDAFAFRGSRVDGPQAHDLFHYSFDKRTARNLTGAGLDRPIGAFEWMNDTDIAALVANGFHNQLTVIGAASRKLITDDSVDPTAFALSSSGAVGYAAGTASLPPELYVDGKRVSHYNPQQLKLVQPELIRYPSFDGLEIEAAVFRPAGAAAPGPLVVMVHGGPTGAFKNSFDALTQLLVSHGFAVLEANIRGSLGYGHKFIEANRADWGGADYKDVMAGVDEMIRRKIADPQHIGIGGWSYGGYMASWAITQTNRFKAAVSGAGMADLAAEFGTEDGSEYDEWFFGTPYENLTTFQKWSPITYIKNARTPTLILQGEADTTDPISQSQILYHGLKRYNVPVEFVVYPREPHGLREQKHILDRYNRTVAWFEKYLR